MKEPPGYGCFRNCLNCKYSYKETIKHPSAGVSKYTPDTKDLPRCERYQKPDDYWEKCCDDWKYCAGGTK